MIEASNLNWEEGEKKEESSQLLFEREGDTEIRRNVVVKYTPMVTLTEISTSAVARVLERKFLTDREFCKETKLDCGRLGCYQGE